ncbi:hypothetical protein E4V01_22700 [Methylorubrum sp. Q1]|uniref:hypothetical protein n=1 Tax=Methylorubrum sp. Q1 TaxID=2562453 RepID=UPI001075DD62|nr:hypothetical protein [Methylorubrum sp. Q1]TFZ55379.1 hypothetical protein E4V01_22700 [Methylorubrum sp. Q1]
MLATVRSRCIAIIFAIIPASARTEGIDSLEKGFYLPPDVGCGGIGGAAGIYFDGHNFSVHYQVCKTFKLSQKNTYKSDCLEGQGANWPKRDEIEKSPDKTSAVINTVVKTNKSFIMDGTRYNHCKSGR